MKRFRLHIKSHTILPDFEDDIMAVNKIEAAKEFKITNSRTFREFSAEDLLPFIEEASDDPKQS